MVRKEKIEIKSKQMIKLSTFCYITNSIIFDLNKKADVFEHGWLGFDFIRSVAYPMLFDHL